MITDYIRRLTAFMVCYAVAAFVQFLGTFSLFWTIGENVLHGIAGAVCIELLLLALNEYGVKQRGRWMAVICAASLALVTASASFQVADLITHEANGKLVERLGPSFYQMLRVLVAAAPSVAMGIVTLIKFNDAARKRNPAPQAVQDAQPGPNVYEAVQSAVGGAMGAIDGRLAAIAEAAQLDAAELRNQIAVTADAVQALGERVAVLSVPPEPRAQLPAAARSAKPRAQLAGGSAARDWPAGSWQSQALPMILDAKRRGEKLNLTQIGAACNPPVTRQAVRKTFIDILEGSNE